MGLREDLAIILAAPPSRPAVGTPPEPRRRLAEDTDEPETIAKLREIVRTKTAGKIGGMTIDLFSASAAVQIYDGLNADNKRKMASLPIRKMMSIVVKMMGAK